VKTGEKAVLPFVGAGVVVVLLLLFAGSGVFFSVLQSVTGNGAGICLCNPIGPNPQWPDNVIQITSEGPGRKALLYDLGAVFNVSSPHVGVDWGFWGPGTLKVETSTDGVNWESLFQTESTSDVEGKFGRQTTGKSWMPIFGRKVRFVRYYVEGSGVIDAQNTYLILSENLDKPPILPDVIRKPTFHKILTPPEPPLLPWPPNLEYSAIWKSSEGTVKGEVTWKQQELLNAWTGGTLDVTEGEGAYPWNAPEQTLLQAIGKEEIPVETPVETEAVLTPTPTPEPVEPATEKPTGIKPSGIGRFVKDFIEVVKRLISDILPFTITGPVEVSSGQTATYVLEIEGPPLDHDFTDGTYTTHFGYWALVDGSGNILEEGEPEELTESTYRDTATITVPANKRAFAIVGVITQVNSVFKDGSWINGEEVLVAKEAISVENKDVIAEGPPPRPEPKGIFGILSALWSFIKSLLT
jgi:hypothetical protein